MTEMLEINTVDGPMPVYEARPPYGSPQGAVLVLHESFGLDDHIKEVARRFADVGLLAFAPNLFHRDNPEPVSYREPDVASARVAGLDRELAIADVTAVLDRLRSTGWRDDQIGVVGFGLGGGLAFVTASRHPLAGAVSFYPVGICDGTLARLPDDALGLQTAWLGLFGARDETILDGEVDALEAVLSQQRGVFTEVVRLPNAGHGFHCDMRPDYVHDAAYEGWQRTVEWFERRLEPPPSELAAAWAERQGPRIGYP